jgi:hypothetical protein
MRVAIIQVDNAGALSVNVVPAGRLPASADEVDASDCVTVAAEGMVLDQHPDGQVNAIDGARVTEENSRRTLAASVRDPLQRPKGA